MKEIESAYKIETFINNEFDKYMDEYEKIHNGVNFDIDTAYVEFYHLAMRYHILEDIIDGKDIDKTLKFWSDTFAKKDFDEVMELME